MLTSKMSCIESTERWLDWSYYVFLKEDLEESKVKELLRESLTNILIEEHKIIQEKNRLHLMFNADGIFCHMKILLYEVIGKQKEYIVVRDWFTGNHTKIITVFDEMCKDLQTRIDVFDKARKPWVKKECKNYFTDSYQYFKSYNSDDLEFLLGKVERGFYEDVETGLRLINTMVNEDTEGYKWFYTNEKLLQVLRSLFENERTSDELLLRISNILLKVSSVKESHEKILLFSDILIKKIRLPENLRIKSCFMREFYYHGVLEFLHAQERLEIGEYLLFTNKNTLKNELIIYDSWIEGEKNVLRYEIREEDETYLEKIMGAMPKYRSFENLLLRREILKIILNLNLSSVYGNLQEILEYEEDDMILFLVNQLLEKKIN